MLFAAMDRLVQLVTRAQAVAEPTRAARHAGQARPGSGGRSRGRWNRVREIPTNGAAASQRAASPVTALATVRVESN